MRRTLLFAALLAGATGCFHVNYVTDKPAAPSPEYDDWHHDLIFGLAELSDPVDVPKICPKGYARIESEMSFVNGLVQVITFNIYNPQTVTVTCVKDGK